MCLHYSAVAVRAAKRGGRPKTPPRRRRISGRRKPGKCVKQRLTFHAFFNRLRFCRAGPPFLICRKA
jgi:hypothetical protein